MTPDPEARITIYALSTRISTRRTPISPGTQFEPGFTCLYAFYEFRAMDWGVPFTPLLYREGVLIGAEPTRWEAERDGRRYYFFCRPEGGYVAGNYELQLFIGNALAARAAFVIREG